MVQQQTTILGAGIIGLATAYHLTRSPRTPGPSIRLIDASPTLFASASGNAGGFLARDWFDAALAPLGALSFDLHARLAREHDGGAQWGWSWTTGVSVDAGRGGRGGDEWLRAGGSRAQTAGAGGYEFWGAEEGPGWLARREGQTVEVISAEGTVAQVQPRRLCEWLLAKVVEAGVKVHLGARALRVDADTRGELAAVRVAEASGEEVDLPCTRLVITAGAWTEKVFRELFPKASARLSIGKLAGHSLILRSPRWGKADLDKGCHAVFSTDRDGFRPEIFSRQGEEIYIAGLNDSQLPLPDRAVDAQVSKEAIERLKEVSYQMMGRDDLEVVREALCFRPVNNRGPLVLSRVSDEKLGTMRSRGGAEGGVFVSAGHGPWGISQSLGTGKVLSELIEGQPPSVDISGLSI